MGGTEESVLETAAELDGARSDAPAMSDGTPDIPRLGDTGLKALLHPNDPKNKLGRQMERAGSQVQELVADIDRAIAQTGSAGGALRTAISQQESLVGKYEQEARAAMASGGKEAARRSAGTTRRLPSWIAS